MKKTTAFFLFLSIFSIFQLTACAPMKQHGPENSSGSFEEAVPLNQGIKNLSLRLEASVRNRQAGRITVADFVGPGNSVHAFGRHVADKIAVRLFASGAFPEFMERNQLKQVLQGLKHEHSGYFDQNTVQQFGKMLGVDSMVIGRIEDMGPVMDVTAKIVQAGTGRLLGMADVQIVKDESVRSLMNRQNTSSLTVTVDPPVNGKVIAGGKEASLSGGMAVIRGLAAGECQVLIQPEGYEPVRRSINISSDSETLGVKLKSRSYEVSFQVNPPDASLVVDGRDITLNPQGFVRISGLEAREYSYVVGAKGHKRRLGKFDPAVDRQMVINLETSDPLLAVGNKLAAKVQKVAGSRQDFHVELWTDKSVYRLGEPIYFNFRTDRDCYLTIIDINSHGEMTQLFPNRFASGNHVRAGITYRIPGPDYGFELEAQPPLGTDRVYAIASTRPMDIFSNDFSQNAFVSVTRGMTRGIGVVGQNIEKTKLNAAAVTTVRISR